MKTFFLLVILFLIICFVVTCCSPQRYCQPSKKSRDYAVRQWVKERADGYWVVTTYRGFKKATVNVFECKPDSMELSKLRL